MMFEDKNGDTWTEEDINALSAWEIEELGIHLLDNFSHRQPARS